MMLAGIHNREERLPSYALFAGFLAAAGLPLYIHAPKVYADEYGVSLATLGVVLFGLRLLDVVQDPLLGYLAEKWRNQREQAIRTGVLLLSAGMLGLFAVVPPVSPVLWFATMLSLVFSAFSFLTICFYAQGVAKAGHLDGAGHLRLARWRESGALFGVCIAAVAPTVLVGQVNQPFAGFAVMFVLLGLAAMMAMRGEWESGGTAPSTGFSAVLRDRVARRLLVVGFLNAAPVAVTSTLFLFFVESRLAAPGWEGPLLLSFFLSAALAAPFWSRLAESFGARAVLLGAMALSIVTFGFAVTLGAGDVMAFTAVCIVSGAALGADLTLLPAIFAARMERVSPSAAEGFGLWSFVTKLTLAVAAVVLLPALGAAGFEPGSAAPEEALVLLGLLYAGLPCILKAGAILVLAFTDLEETLA